MDHPLIKFLPYFVRTRLEGRHLLQRTIGNAGWLFTDNITRMGVGFLVNIWIVRYLGPEQYGIYCYAFAFVSLFSIFASLGVDSIVIRDIIKDPSCKENILGSAFLLKVIGGFIAFSLSFVSISLLRPTDSLTHWLVGIIAAGTIFQSFDVIDSWFQSQLQAKYVVYAKNSAFLLISAAKIILVIVEAPLKAFAVTVFAEAVLGAGGLVLAYTAKGNYLRSWMPRLREAKKLLQESWSLILSGILIMIFMRIDQVMLRELSGEKVVGIYSAAVPLSEAYYFLSIMIVNSSTPALIEAKKINPHLYASRLQQLHDVLFSMAFLIAFAVSYLSPYIITLLYGEQFSAAAKVLAINIWAGVFVFHGILRGQYLIIENKQNIGLWFRGLGALINIGLNFILIPEYGAIGAAWATLISYGSPVFIVALFHPLVRTNTAMCLKSYIFPIRALLYKRALYQ